MFGGERREGEGDEGVMTASHQLIYKQVWGFISIVFIY